MKLFITILLMLSSIQATTLMLKSGWNLVGSNSQITDVNTTIPNATTIWKYGVNGWVVTSPNGSQSANIANSTYSMFSQISAGQGFWVNTTSDESITLFSTPPSDTTLNLVTGWNLVSLKTDYDINVSDYFDNSFVELVWQYDKTNNNWKAFSHSLSSEISSAGISQIGMIKVGEGFWAKSVDTTSIAFNSVTTDIDFTDLAGKTIYFENESGAFGIRSFESNGTTTGITSFQGEFAGTYTTLGDTVSISVPGYNDLNLLFSTQPNFANLGTINVSVGTSISTWENAHPLPVELLNKTIAYNGGTSFFTDKGIVYETTDNNATLVPSGYNYKDGNITIRDGNITTIVALDSNLTNMPVLIISDSGAFADIEGNTTWTLPSTTTGATPLQRSLAGFVSGSASALASAGEAASNSTAGIATDTNGTNALVRVLYNPYIPPFEISDGNNSMVMTMANIVGDANATATIQFKVSGLVQNPHYVLDTTGESYGLNNMEATMQGLGGFFGGFATAGTTQTELITYVTSNVGTHIQAVSTIKNSPLFSLVGDTALHTFIDGFPVDATSAGYADWSALGSQFQTLISNLNTSIDFSQIYLYTNIALTTLDIGAIEVNLQGLDNTNALIPLTDYQSGNLVTLNLTSNGGNAYIAGTTAYLTNVELNVTIDPANPSGATVNGSYDISVLINGETYTGTPTFDKNGCKGADIYDGSGNFVSRMKIFNDGLWIVDANNVQIEKVTTGI